MNTFFSLIGVIIGGCLGFIIAGTLISGKAQEQWHNGYRAGRYGQKGSGE